MATNWQALALEQAELISSRLRELLSSGQGYIRSHFGVELGLRPEQYPSWVVLLTAVVGLLVVLSLSWAAVCGSGKKRRTSASNDSGGEPLKASMIKTVKSEEQKKKNKKKSADKKAQSNGRTIPEPQVEARGDVGEEISKPPPILAPEIEIEKPLFAQVKKIKKKPKPEVKPAKSVLLSDGKEPDDGAWETKVSNREKKQQRRKDKGPDGSGIPGDVETSSYQTSSPNVTAPVPTTRKNKEPLRTRAGGKGDAVIAPANPRWREEPSVNGGGWADVSTKFSTQMSILEGDKWPAMPTVPRNRNPEPQTWEQETEGKWSGIDGRIKPEHNPVTFSVLGLKTTAAEPRPEAEQQWDRQPAVEDEWSGFNGVAAADPSSDWNAPTELWGNYEEPPLVEAPALPSQEQAIPQAGKVSDEGKEEVASGGAAKSKKKKKKKKKPEDEGGLAQVNLESSIQPVSNMLPKAHQSEELPPVVTSTKQFPTMPPSQKKSDPISEPPKLAQKKKVRRET